MIYQQYLRLWQGQSRNKWRRSPQFQITAATNLNQTLRYDTTSTCPFFHCHYVSQIIGWANTVWCVPIYLENFTHIITRKIIINFHMHTDFAEQLPSSLAVLIYNSFVGLAYAARFWISGQVFKDNSVKGWGRGRFGRGRWWGAWRDIVRGLWRELCSWWVLDLLWYLWEVVPWEVC